MSDELLFGGLLHAAAVGVLMWPLVKGYRRSVGLGRFMLLTAPLLVWWTYSSAPYTWVSSARGLQQRLNEYFATFPSLSVADAWLWGYVATFVVVWGSVLLLEVVILQVHRRVIQPGASSGRLPPSSSSAVRNCPKCGAEYPLSDSPVYGGRPDCRSCGAELPRY